MTPLRKLIAALTLTALLALAVAGCGGGGGSDTTATTAKTVEEPAPLTKSELISQGDGICGEVNAAVGSVGASAADPISQGTQVANLYIQMVESIKNLGAPAEKSPEYDEFIAAAEELAKVEGEIKLAAEREDTEALGAAATKATPILESFESTATAYGFEECGKGPSTPSAAPSTGSESEEVEEGGVEVEPEVEEEIVPEEVAPEEVAPETGGAGGLPEEEAAPPAEEGGGSSGGVGPG